MYVWTVRVMERRSILTKTPPLRPLPPFGRQLKRGLSLTLAHLLCLNGLQLSAIKAHLAQNPDVKYLWYDYWSMYVCRSKALPLSNPE